MLNNEHQEDKNSISDASTTLTLNELRERARKSIEEELSKSVFKSLKKQGLESIVLYLISISLKPIVDTYSKRPQDISDLVKKIWSQQGDIFLFYLEQKLDQSRLAESVDAILDIDRFGARIFERLLIFSEAVSSVEENFSNKEWVLRQLRNELQDWHKVGKFQQIEVTIPSDQFAPSMLRGDLQVRISTSKSTIIAGHEFSVFVVIIHLKSQLLSTQWKPKFQLK